MIDTHCHIDDEQYAPLAEYLLTQQAGGVEAIIVPATTAASSKEILELCSSLNSQLSTTLHSTLSTLNYDIVISNPPYVMESEKSSMDSTVLDYEPASALFVPDSDPLRFYRRIAELRLGTWLYFEINEQKGAAVCDLLASLGYVDIEIKKDSYGKERMVRARLAR